MVPPRVRDVVAAVVFALVVGLSRWPSSGNDSNPPTCSNVLGSPTPCDGPVWSVALIAGVIVFLVAWGLTYIAARRGES